ncbi:centrosome and spindle pole-associated protein 1 isoform X1 [Oreochromis niloticus]|uniref:centrosome and spindle pole-associated protein 1 isoform X1 n=1 Tax=Oreochromis niloticus TaxID=8128 RepID=UPI00039418B4|nr:centrosome and spindle pole-associated protein 1 isoform X1 [Oreochromis niloticus]XP_019218707.1 centrosome and spindle pole-associated protein 1 isoform X1 [Oreochromis niloticus]
MTSAAALGVNPNPDRGIGLSHLLGTEYERKKQKLQQELQLDYRNYISRKTDLKSRQPQQQLHGVSLPIDERISVKEKLREERNKEYNLFLQEQAQIRTLKRRTSSVSPKRGQIQASDGLKISPPASPLSSHHKHTHTNIVPIHNERKDASTLTEVFNDGEIGNQVQRRRRRWQIHRAEPYSSEDELNTDRGDEFDLRYRRRKDRHTQEPEYKEEMTAQECRVKKASQDIKETAASTVSDQKTNDTILKSDLQVPASMKMAARSAVRKDKADFATGLLIGATEEQEITQMRKEQYRQELLRQIAEKQRKKMEEKRLELRVDPEKEPDRIQQLGSVNRHYNSLSQDVLHKLGKDLEAEGKHLNASLENSKPTENADERAPPGKSQVDFITALTQLPGKTVPSNGMELLQGVPSLDYFSEDYHRDFSNILGEVTIPRVPSVAPPLPPIVPHNYKTPYDADYYYYGSRNPLDPHLPHNPNGLPGGNRQSENSKILSQRTRPLRSSGHNEETHQHGASALVFGELHAEKSKQRRESVLSYQETLRQQIKEREEHRRIEKEEAARLNAKIEAEMKAYNPWGRSGGGAPIRDQKGNLVSDLNQMHRINEASYRNPVPTPGTETSSPISHRLTGFKDETLQQQDSYRAALKQQIEGNKRKQEEERERIRIEEEKEEKRLAIERARLQEEYEEEQRKEKRRTEHKLKNQGWIHEAETHREKQEKVVRQERETKKVPQTTRVEKDSRLNYERQPSPPVPTLQKKLANLAPSRPSSVLSQRSSRTNRSVSAPHHRPPDKIPSQQDDQQEVIRKLSALCSYLRKEQRQLEVQMGRTDSHETHYNLVNRRRPRADALKSAHREAVLSSARSPSPADAHANRQNIREFIQLKHRADTTSREEVRTLYPDPPADAQSLDIQQQALLREQQHKIRLMKRQEDGDFLGHQLGHYYPIKNPGRATHRNPILPSESSFIDYSGEAREQRSPQPSAEHQERTVPRRRLNYDEVADKGGDNLPAVPSLNNQNKRHITRPDSHSGDHSIKDWLPGDEADVSSLGSAMGRRISVDTVATELWLRPGTSDAVKQ